jgi:acyl-CoA synthetase (AMP-forming)/AMP-acid ligase II
MTVTGMPAGPVTVTQRLIGLGAARGEHAALEGGSATWPGRALSYAALARILMAAAAGLARRGVRPGDVVGVHVPDAVSYALAGHAIRAAGAVPSPLPYGAPAAVLASQLSHSTARLLVTAGPRAGTALSGADGSWVRQVLSFDEVPGTTLFCSLLRWGSSPPATAADSDLALLPYRAGPGGDRRPAPVTHAEFAAALDATALDTTGLDTTARDATARDATAGEAGGPQLTGADVVLVTPPGDGGRDYTVLLDLALLSGATVVATPAAGLAGAARRHGGTAVIAAPGVPVPAGLARLSVTAPG